jgi:hypothetical protein
MALGPPGSTVRRVLVTAWRNSGEAGVQLDPWERCRDGAHVQREDFANIFWPIRSER